ncbi:MAG: hypothetical protein EPO09_07345 [Aquabacterium sp.]|uniref:hypothetical protein n=1 Tax=Aquabacterium sp. TaxID=1872578 RepID=UPI001217030B|nr:hypothetical protein [Aquabacterium sp.]TAK95775.1 MAG: hypothetical protein EPO09_07345 [Aquabacterium sp.]
MADENLTAEPTPLTSLYDEILRRITKAQGITSMLCDALNDAQSSAAWAASDLLCEAEDMLTRYDAMAREQVKQPRA